MKGTGARFAAIAVFVGFLVAGALLFGPPRGAAPASEAGSGTAAPAQTPAASDEEAVIAALRQTMQAFNDNDFAAYMDGFDPESPDRDLTKGLAENLFRTYRFDVTIDRVEVEKIEGDLATVRAIQTTRRVSGPEFRDNTIEAVHTFRRHNGRWLLRSTEVEKTTYLDGRPAD